MFKNIFCKSINSKFQKIDKSPLSLYSKQKNLNITCKDFDHNKTKTVGIPVNWSVKQNKKIGLKNKNL